MDVYYQEGNSFTELNYHVKQIFYPYLDSMNDYYYERVYYGSQDPSSTGAFPNGVFQNISWTQRWKTHTDPAAITTAEIEAITGISINVNGDSTPY